MERLVKPGGRAPPWASCCAALAAVLALAGCGGLVTVGSTVVSGAEAVGTLVKEAVNEEGGNADKGAAAPK